MSEDVKAEIAAFWATQPPETKMVMLFRDADAYAEWLEAEGFTGQPEYDRRAIPRTERPQRMHSFVELD